MPKIVAEGKTFEVAQATNLREALLDRDMVTCASHDSMGILGTVNIPSGHPNRD